MPQIFFDPFTGAAGNMILAALFDLGAPPAAVEAAVRSTGLTGFSVVFERNRDRHGLVSGVCEVRIEGGPRPHRHLSDILECIEKATVSERVRQQARAVFTRLAEAEATVHRVSVDHVHFHEVGAVDAIVDVLGTCVALEELDVDRVYCGPFKVGRGTTECAHGILPVPAPATASLLEGEMFERLNIEAELTTPTGAALLTTLSQGDWGGIAARCLRCGTGRGSRSFPGRPNILRAFLVEVSRPLEAVEVLETDVDDESPEIMAALTERLRRAGALDATLTPLIMKKGRTGTRLTVISRPGDSPRLADLVFRESSTIGIRVTRASRYVLPRSETTVETPWGPVRAKRLERPHGVEIAPEFEAARDLARTAGVPVRDVMHAVRKTIPTEDNGAK
ncbi:MAG: nickel pincer cofactor biosynthesis protein LarC [Kiritimatiellaeota bacterium]|nr:nickel pincer cofactor biosynthesis protein LarC [Kiritimatiellota bacterium]